MSQDKNQSINKESSDLFHGKTLKEWSSMTKPEADQHCFEHDFDFPALVGQIAAAGLNFAQPPEYSGDRKVESDRKPRKGKITLPLVYGTEGYDDEEDFLIRSWLPKGFCVMTAAAKSFKTFVAIDMAASIATGTPWIGNAVDCRGAVLYIAAESGKGVIRRKRAWELRRKTQADHLVIIPQPVFPTQENYERALSEAITAVERQTGQKVELVVWDTLARCFDGDENTAKDMGNFIQAIDRVRTQHNTGALVVHHMGKDVTKKARGSTALVGALDAQLIINRPAMGEDQPVQKPTVIIRCTEMKESEEPAAMAIELVKQNIFQSKKTGQWVDSLVLETTPCDMPTEDAPDAPKTQKAKGNRTKGEAVAIIRASGRMMRRDFKQAIIDAGIAGVSRADYVINELEACGSIAFVGKTENRRADYEIVFNAQRDPQWSQLNAEDDFE